MKPVIKPLLRSINLHTPPPVQRAVPAAPMTGRQSLQPFRPQPVRATAPAPFRPASANVAKPPSLQPRPVPHAGRISPPPIRPQVSSASLPIQQRVAGCSNMMQVAASPAVWNYYSGLTNQYRAQFRALLGSAVNYSLEEVEARLRPLGSPVGEYTHGGRTVRVYGVGGRYKEHVSPGTALDYFRQYANEIVAGGNNTLLVGVGRDRGYGVYGNIRYAFNGSEITYWHAHDDGTRMG